MEVETTPLSGLLVIKPKVFGDARGYFLEVGHAKRYCDAGLPEFVQTNISRSKKGALRGLHFQNPNAQGKLVGVTRGRVFDVAVDIRQSSKTFGQWYGLELSDENHHQLYVPTGFAHGFCVLSDTADFYYQCTDYYSPQAEHGIAWNDQDINISWPISEPVLSEKDQRYPFLSELTRDVLF